MPRFKSGLACPICDTLHVESELWVEAGGGGARTICATGRPDHSWTDQEELRGLAPRKLTIVPRPDAVQKDYVTVTLNVPVSVQKALDARFGEKLPTSLTSLLQAAAEPKMMVLSASDLARLGERLGAEPKSSSELFGLIFAQGERVKEVTNDLQRTKRQAGARASGNGTVVDLGPWMSKGVAKAADAGISLEEYLSKYLRDSLENDWMS